MSNLSMKQSLTPHQLQLVDSEAGKLRRSTGVSYALWFFLGWVGAHQFYLRNPAKGVFFLVAGCGPMISFIMGTATFFSMAGARAGADPAAQKAAMQATGAATGIWALACVLLFVAYGLGMLWDMFTLAGQTERANEKIERGVISQISAGAKP